MRAASVFPEKIICHLCFSNQTEQILSVFILHIIALIRPLAEQGILLHRSREYLETIFPSFSVLEHDQNIYGCVALKTFAEPDCGELACLVVSPEARDGGYGELLLEHLFQKARALNIKNALRLIHAHGRMVCRTGLSDGLGR